MSLRKGSETFENDALMKPLTMQTARIPPTHVGAGDDAKRAQSLPSAEGRA